MAFNDKKIIFKLDAENQKLRKSLSEADQALEKSKSSHSSLKSIGTAVWGAIAGAVSGALIAFKEIIGILSDFDKGMRNVNSILGLSEDKFKSLENEVLNVQSELGISSKELTDALYQAVSAGVEAADAISFLREAGKVGVAGVATTTEAVDILTTVMNAFHIEASDTQKVSDVLFQTIKLGKTNLAELSAAMAQVAPIAAANKVDFEEVSAAIASLTKQGVPTAQAVTQIRSSIVSMNDVLGDGWAQTMTYQEAVAEVAKQAGGSNTKLKEMLGRIEAVNAVLGLTGQNAQTAADDLNAMNNSLGAASDAFDEQSKAIEVRWNKFTAAFTAETTKVTNRLLDWLLPLEKSASIVDKAVSNAQDMQIQFTELSNTYRILRDQTTKTQAEQKLYKDTIDKLNELYPNYLKNVDLEASSRGDVEQALVDAGKALDDYVAKQVRAALIQQKQNEIVKLSSQIAEVEIARIKALAQQSEQERLQIGTQAIENLFAGSKKILEDRKKEITKELEITQQVIGSFYKNILEPGGSGKKSTDKTTEEIKKNKDEIVKAINDIEIHINKLPEISKKAFDGSIDTVKDYVEELKEKTAEIGYLASDVGAAFVSGFDTEGFKGALKNVLITLIGFLEKEIIAAQVAATARSIFGDFSAFAQIAGLTALFEAAKVSIASFRTGVENYDGGLAKVHKDELITNLPAGANVHTKAETERLFDLKPLIKEIRVLTNEVRTLQRPVEVIKGETVYRMYNQQHKKLLSTKN